MLRPQLLEAHLLYEGVPHLLLTTGAGGRTTWGNHAWRAYTGFAEDDTPAPGLSDVVHPDDRTALARALATRRSGGRGQHFEVRLRHIDGAYRWFDLQSRELDTAAGEDQAWLITATNIDHLKDEQSHRKVLQDIIDASTDCIKVLDLDARLLMMNQGGLDAMGLDDFERCRNQPWPTLWDDDSHRKVNAALDLARGGQRATFEGVAVTFRGVRRWWEVSVSPLFDERGTIHRLVAISRDITEHKTAQRELADDYATLEDRVLERTRQLQEERTALDSFVAFSEALGRDADVVDLARRAMRAVRTNLMHVGAVYFEFDADRWKARVWSDDLPDDVVAAVRSGVPQGAPHFAEVAARMTPLFVDGHGARVRFVPGATRYGAVALIPIVIREQVVSLFVVVARGPHVWSERERAVVHAVGRGLNLAVDRTEQARQLADRTSELAAHAQELALRIRVFEAFVVLTGDLTRERDVVALVRCASRAVLSVLPGGHVVYLEFDGQAWRSRVETGDPRSEAPRPAPDTVPSNVLEELCTAFETREAHYRCAPGSGVRATASAALPVSVNGEVRGVLAVTVPGASQAWPMVTRDFLQAVTRSLGLALERNG